MIIYSLVGIPISFRICCFQQRLKFKLNLCSKWGNQYWNPLELAPTLGWYIIIWTNHKISSNLIKCRSSFNSLSYQAWNKTKESLLDDDLSASQVWAKWNSAWLHSTHGWLLRDISKERKKGMTHHNIYNYGMLTFAVTLQFVPGWQGQLSTEGNAFGSSWNEIAAFGDFVKKKIMWYGAFKAKVYLHGVLPFQLSLHAMEKKLPK